jgi:carbamoyltransferase
MGRWFTDRLVDLLGAPRSRRNEITQRDKDIARSCQVRFEEAAVHCLRRLHGLVPTERIVMAGGCALNGVANARILRDTPFRTPYLQAASSDDGTCLGAAYWCYHNVVRGPGRFHMQHAFWGPAHTEQAIEATLAGCPYPHVRLEREELLQRVARCLRRGLIVGWFQGQGEWGPRALGNRSILADPTHPDMKDIINRKIKRRESFRPFAPSVLAEAVDKYFEQTVSSPFMMHVVKFKPEWRARLPAVAHFDGTGRLQSVSRDGNPLYYDLISRFAELSGVKIVLNTSFNENEPIVDTPQQAYDCFARNDMDVVCLGNWFVAKQKDW